MKDPFRARADVRKARGDVGRAWAEVKKTARPIRGFLLVALTVASVLAWLAVESLRWLGVADLPWWVIPPVAVVVFFVLLRVVVTAGEATLDILKRRSEERP